MNQTLIGELNLILLRRRIDSLICRLNFKKNDLLVVLSSSHWTNVIDIIIACSITARKSFRLVRDLGERPLNTSQCDHALEPTDQSAASTKEGREGVKWELGFAFFRGWELGFCALGLGFMKKRTIEKREWDFNLSNTCWDCGI